MYTRLCAGLFFPLHERLKGHSTVTLRKQLEESQWWSPERLNRLRVQRLRAFLQRIGSTVPYYQRLFAQERFAPNSIESLDALARLPFLTKPLIRAQSESLKATDAGALTRYNTGGSSGEPLIFYIGKARKSHDVAAKWRATRWWNADIGDREVVVWGSPIELGTQDRLRRLRDGLMRSHLLPAFELSEVNLDRFAQTIRRLRPRMLFGYPSSLALIALHARGKGHAMDELGIRVAFVTSERLYDDQRQIIGSVFGCPVANGYGARDAGFIAHECPSGNLHISAEDIIVETVRPDGAAAAPGEAGEIVVTHMATPEFPFVRYRTGDIGVLSEAACACGRGLPVLSEVEGRASDFVVARDGTVMHGLALIYPIRDLPGIERFAILQESLDRTEVRLVTGAAFDTAHEAGIVRAFKSRLGEGVEIVIRKVPSIAPEASGKFRYVTSKVAVDRPLERTSHA